MRRLTKFAVPHDLIGSAWRVIGPAGLIGLGHRSTALTIPQLRLQSKIRVLALPISSVHVTEATRYARGARLVIDVYGDVEMVINLDRSRLSKVDEARRCARFVLPAPFASRTRLDHNHTRRLQINRTGPWQVVPSGDAEVWLVNAAMTGAQRTLKSAADDPDIAGQDQEHATLVAQDAAASMGWRLVVRLVGWRVCSDFFQVHARSHDPALAGSRLC